MGMKILRIYMENSATGGYFDDELSRIPKSSTTQVSPSHGIAGVPAGAPMTWWFP